MHDRAGTRALPEDLINVDDVISAYYDIVPDPTDVGQRVAFGTSGHRGASLDGKFNEAHIIAITDEDSMLKAAKVLTERFPIAVLIKGGHLVESADDTQDQTTADNSEQDSTSPEGGVIALAVGPAGNW